MNQFSQWLVSLVTLSVILVLCFGVLFSGAIMIEFIDQGSFPYAWESFFATSFFVMLSVTKAIIFNKNE